MWQKFIDRFFGFKLTFGSGKKSKLIFWSSEIKKEKPKDVAEGSLNPWNIHRG